MNARVFHAGFWCALLGALLAGGCKPAPTSGSEGGPWVLHLGYTPSEEAVSNREQATRALAGYLERELGVKVELVRTASYGPAVDAMARGEIDLMSLAPFAYVLASGQGVAEVLVATGGADGQIRTYQSSLITHRRTGLTHLAEMTGRARELRLDFSDPASNSGHLVPQARLRSLGLESERDFKQVDFTLSHSVSVFNVLYGQSDLAGVSSTVLKRLTAKGRVPEGELVVLWESERLPSGPIAVRPSLPETLKRDLRAALLELPRRAPAVALVVMAQYQEPGVIFVPGDDSHYDGLRRLAQAEGQAPLFTAGGR